MRNLLIFLLLISQNIFAMGDPNFLPANPASPPEKVPDLHDLEDTTLRINQFEQEEDQQSQEEKNQDQAKQQNKPKPKRQAHERIDP